jgi:hypothetical protein
MSKSGYYTHDPPRWSKPWWGQTVRTLFWVLVVSILVWTYADIEFTDTVELRATIRLTTGNSANLSLVSRKEFEVGFTVNGSRTQLEEFRRQLAEYRRIVTYDVSQRYGADTEEHTVALREILNQAAATRLEERGISIQETRPEFITFRLEERVTREIPVQLEYEGAEVTDAEISPARVRVSAPASTWARIDQRYPAGDPVVRTQVLDLKGATEGEKVRTTVGLQPFVGELAPAPARVSVSLEIKRHTATTTKTVTVRVITPFKWANDGTWSKWRLRTPETEVWRRTLEFRGPRTEVESLQAEDIDAFIELRESDKTPIESWLTRDVKVHLGRQLNVRLAEGQQDLLKVEFRLEPVGAATP